MPLNDSIGIATIWADYLNDSPAFSNNVFANDIGMPWILTKKRVNLKDFWYIDISKILWKIWKWTTTLTSSEQTQFGIYSEARSHLRTRIVFIRPPSQTLGSGEHALQLIKIKWNFVGDVMDRNYDLITFISKYLYFKKAWDCHFCWHHQNCNHIY